MKQKLSKTIAVILSMIMALTSLSVTAFADDSTDTRETTYTWNFGSIDSSTEINGGKEWLFTDNGVYGAVYVDASNGKLKYNGSTWCQSGVK
ncbi:MAG: hypothetical protein LUH47_08110 [Clostridiales bacterium]|nr:hypothetical protein [Clostridiales bacterium]